MTQRWVAAVTGFVRNDRVSVPDESHRELARPASARIRVALALGAGALLAASFAPLDFWPLAVLCPATLMWLWQGATPREAAWLGFWFNSATFAAGTYWLYISIHFFGPAPIWLAVALMLALVVIMGLYHAALGFVVARSLPARGAIRWLLAAPAVGDVDGDGRLEVVAVTRDGYLWVWHTPTRAGASALVWPSFSHDLRNTGRYG